MTRFILVFLVIALTHFAQAHDILIVTDVPSTDTAYADFLSSSEGGNHKVDISEAKEFTGDLSKDQLKKLKKYDLIILSRSTTSSEYASSKWNTISVPIIIANWNIVKQDVWEMLDNMPHMEEYHANIKITEPSHPIFKSVVDSAGVASYYTQTMKTLVAKETGIEGNGTVLATTPEGKVMIAIWEKGKPFYEGSDKSPKDIRMVINLGRFKDDKKKGKYFLTWSDVHLNSQKILANSIKFCIEGK